MALSGTQRRRLDERLAVLQGSLTEQQYLLHLQSPSGAAELSTLISVVAVHKTDLFRDEVQLAAFRAHVLEPLVASVAGAAAARVERGAAPRARRWPRCSSCSTRPGRIWAARCWARTSPRRRSTARGR